MRNEKKVIGYPTNLLTELGLSEKEAIDFCGNKDRENGLDFVINKLEEKQVKVITAFYREHLSAEKIAEKYGVTRSRIYDIKKKAILALRTPYNQRFYMYGIEGTKELEKQEQIQEQIAFQEKCRNFNNLPFTELEGVVSVRTYNAVNRHCIWSKRNPYTLGELSAMSEDELVKTLRNLGIKCARELHEGIKALRDKYNANGKTKEEYLNEFYGVAPAEILDAVFDRLENKDSADTQAFVSAVKSKLNCCFIKYDTNEL